MRAVVCRNFADLKSVAVEEMPSPEPGPGGVVVRVAAAGLTFPDLLMTEDKYQHKPGLPFIVGTEIAGTVVRVGSDVRNVAVGDRIVAKVAHGGFAEEVVVPSASRLYPIPDGLDFTTAASFPANYCTSLYALRHRADLKEGETLMVLGASGGVGLAAVEIGKLLGARVIACCGSEAKAALTRDRGADVAINYDAGAQAGLDAQAATAQFRAAIKAAAGGNGPHVILDTVGGRYADPAFREIAWGGRYLVVGFASGEIPRLPFNLALLKGASLVGVSLGGATRNEPGVERACMVDLAAWIGDGRLAPHISAIHRFDDVGEALAAIKERRVVGKIVLVP